MKKLAVLLAIVFYAQCFAHDASAAAEVQVDLSLTKLIQNMTDYEKKDISLVATVLGACGSGCKIWVGEGQYKKGDPVALVWAKDDAFKFKTDATGKQVKLQGFAVGTYIDLCAIEKQEKKETKAENVKNKADSQVAMKDGKACATPPALQASNNNETTKQLKSITFFATSVDYL